MDLWQAEHELALGRREPAREATRLNLEVCQRLGWRGHAAHCHTVLGLLAVGDHQLEAASEHLVQARAWSRTSNEVEMLLRCHELSARLALARGRPAEAEREAEAGLSLAAACGSLADPLSVTRTTVAPKSWFRVELPPSWPAGLSCVPQHEARWPGRASDDSRETRWYGRRS
ncbi:hypothetical protein [Archangium sp.]|uniref:hypothetical protein n=1 Tax=Archangium sp. TaxID=1872627 RepID=UPI002D297A8F|nr:hypothetical protein [Archangium sp.]HYO58793.1 hypothetical protein [Archangium sp.]